jgi:predicted alpha/beta hydrolase family esterase
MKKNNAQSLGNPLPLRIIHSVYPFLEKVIPVLAFKLAFNLFFTPIRYKTPDRELPVQQNANKFETKIDGKRTQFYSWGNEQRPLIVLVHGWMGRASQFFKLIDALVAQDYHVVSFDGPAHGASSGRQTNLNEFAKAINYIANRFGSISVAIGHSFGGITILNAINNGLKINNVVFIATPSIAGDIIKDFEKKINGSPATGINFRKEILKRYGITFESISASELIKLISIESLLLVHDANDRDVPISHAKLLEDLFPQATTIYTEGLGHTRILRNDQVIAQISEHIDRVVGVSPTA